MVADADIADLIAAGDYVGAAARAVAEGDLRRAITLYERVGGSPRRCRWPSAWGIRRWPSGWPWTPGTAPGPRPSPRPFPPTGARIWMPPARRSPAGRALPRAPSWRSGPGRSSARRPCTGAAACRWRRRGPWNGRGCGTTPGGRTSRSPARRPRTGTRRPRPRPSWRWGRCWAGWGARVMRFAPCRRPRATRAPPRPPPAGCAWSWAPWACPTPRTRSPGGCTRPTRICPTAPRPSPSWNCRRAAAGCCRPSRCGGSGSCG